MAIDLEDEILQDFLVEASEILDQLGEQLVELEQSPDDYELLNAIFRGFHTVKGGAGFLALTALVDLCHNAENVFDVLRQGDRRVDATLMDVVLQVLDIVNEMFGEIRAGEDPTPADQSVLDTLSIYTKPMDEDEQAAISDPAESSVTTASAEEEDLIEAEFEAMLDSAAKKEAPGEASDEINEQEFDELLDALHGSGGSPTPSGISDEQQDSESEESSGGIATSDEITEQEFDTLLDQLHGKDASSGGQQTQQEQGKEIAEMPKTGEISEQEFDDLLDNLHGKGKHSVPEVKVEPLESESAAVVPPEQPSSTVKETSQQSVVESESSAVVEAPTPVAAIKKPKEKKPVKSQGAPVEATVRVDTQRLDDIMNMVGELVLVRNRFETLKNLTQDEEIGKAVANLDVVTSDLQLAVMKTRMQPIKKVFGRFPRVVRDLARNLNKDINLELRGEETDLDKNLVEALADPLVHLVRNAVDHGVEMPEIREAAGKPRQGHVILTASQEGDHIELSIEDDGKGMNPEMLRGKVVEKGLMDEEAAARLDDRGCFNLIFMPGFSTKTEISDVSGRGVGMDVVKTSIVKMNGTVDVDSVEGQGSRIIIKVPLTLAIMPTLMVKLSDQPFAFPLSSVVEILDLDLSKTNNVDGQLVVIVRDRTLPLFYIKEWLVQGYMRTGTEDDFRGHVVVVNLGGRHVGFVVDHLIGQEEVVIKPLGAQLHGLPGLAGATVTGDGNIALILDMPGLMKKFAA